MNNTDEIEVMPEELQALLRDYAIKNEIPNDPLNRPFITLTMQSKKKAKVYLHFLERAELLHVSPWTRIYVDGKSRLVVSETPKQIYYLVACALDVQEYDADIFRAIKVERNFEKVIALAEIKGKGCRCWHEDNSEVK